MSERPQSVTPRPRKPAARPKRATPVAANRRKADVRRWLRLGLILVAVAVPLAGAVVLARSGAFALRHVEVLGAKRTPSDKIEQVVREAGGGGIFVADLDAIRAAVESERYVRTAAVVRVFPDTIRVRIEEREPAIVARLGSGKLVWVDREAKVLDEYRTERGETVPPPLLGFVDGDRSERVTAENRDRIAAYEKIREALTPDDLWNRCDEVDLRFVRDASVQLADNAIVVRLGDGDYHGRLTRALILLDAARRGDTETLARYHVPDAGTLLASADAINQIDMTRANGSVTFSFSRRKAAPDAGAAPPASAPGAQPSGKPDAKPPAKSESKPKPAAAPEPRPKAAEPGTERRRTVTQPTAHAVLPDGARLQTRRM